MSQPPAGYAVFVCPVGHVTSAPQRSRCYRVCGRMLDGASKPKPGARFTPAVFCDQAAAKLSPAARGLATLAGLEVGVDRAVNWTDPDAGGMVRRVKTTTHDKWEAGLAVLREMGWPEDGPWRAGSSKRLP